MTIGNSSFESSYMTSVTIPAGVTTIEDSAFMSCKDLKSIVIPEGVTTMGDSVFMMCVNLVSISLPTTLKTMGYSGFDYTKINKPVYFNG